MDWKPFCIIIDGKIIVIFPIINFTTFLKTELFSELSFLSNNNNKCKPYFCICFYFCDILIFRHQSFLNGNMCLNMTSVLKWQTFPSRNCLCLCFRINIELWPKRKWVRGILLVRARICFSVVCISSLHAILIGKLFLWHFFPHYCCWMNYCCGWWMKNSTFNRKGNDIWGVIVWLLGFLWLYNSLAYFQV